MTGGDGVGDHWDVAWLGSKAIHCGGKIVSGSSMCEGEFKELDSSSGLDKGSGPWGISELAACLSGRDGGSVPFLVEGVG